MSLTSGKLSLITENAHLTVGLQEAMRKLTVHQQAREPMSNSDSTSATQATPEIDFPEERAAKRIRLGSQLSPPSSTNLNGIISEINQNLGPRTSDSIAGLSDIAS